MKAYLRFGILSGMMTLKDDHVPERLFIAVPTMMSEIYMSSEHKQISQFPTLGKMEFEYRRRLNDELLEYEFLRMS